jgi:Xaa-Pro aminopeptidase
MTEAIIDEDERTAQLIAAQAKAAHLFEAVAASDILRPGTTELRASDAIRDLANDLFGDTRHWHKRIVRAGPNTLEPYRINPPNLELQPDDIAFCDFGPIFGEWEADFGRTFVLGHDPSKLRLRDDLPRVWDAGREFYRAHPDLTGEQLFAAVTDLAAAAGWEFGGSIAGHLIGEFPHEKNTGDDVDAHVTPGSNRPMRRTDRTGRVCHWILEVHLVDRARQIGGFHEELLDIG